MRKFISLNGGVVPNKIILKIINDCLLLIKAMKKWLKIDKIKNNFSLKTILFSLTHAFHFFVISSIATYNVVIILSYS